MLDAFRSTFNPRQKNVDILNDYTRQFKTSTEIFKYHLVGPLILERYVNRIEVYNKKILSKQAQW